MVASDASGEARSYARSAGLLTLALGVAGVLIYVFFAIASHSLGSDDYGLIVVLWSAIFLIVSTLFRPVEQLLARTIAELEERQRPVIHALRVAAGIQLATACAFALIAIILRGSIETELFNGESTYFWVMVGAVLAFSASYYARGYLAGSGRMGAYAGLLVTEGVARLILALSVAIGIADGADPIALSIVLAPVLSLLVLPLALRRKLEDKAPAQTGRAPGLDVTSDFTLAQGGGFAAAVLVIMLSEQAILNSGALFVHVNEGPAAAGFIFNVLMVVRAPVVLFQAVAASLLPHLTRLRSRDDLESDSAYRLSMRMTILVIAGFSTATLLGVLAFGPQVMQLAFGDNFEYHRVDLAIVAFGMGFYLASGTLSQSALATGQIRRAAICWVIAAATFIIINLLPVLDAFRRVEVGLAVSAVLLLVLLAANTRTGSGRSDYTPKPGSPLERELRTAIDEIG